MVYNLFTTLLSLVLMLNVGYSQVFNSITDSTSFNTVKTEEFRPYTVIDVIVVDTSLTDNPFNNFSNEYFGDSVTVGVDEKEDKSVVSSMMLTGGGKNMSLPLNEIYVTSGYGKRLDPFNGVLSNHRGVDLRANNDTVKSMLAGIVSKVSYDKALGINVRVNHGSYTIIYGHLSTMLVSIGDEVYAGQPIAFTGNTGRSTAEHLHISIKEGKKHIDPTPYLDFLVLLEKYKEY